MFSSFPKMLFGSRSLQVVAIWQLWEIGAWRLCVYILQRWACTYPRFANGLQNAEKTCVGGCTIRECGVKTGVTIVQYRTSPVFVIQYREREQMAPENTRTMLTVAETADLLGLHPRTIHRFTASGELPFVRLTRRAIRIRRADVEALIQARTINNAA